MVDISREDVLKLAELSSLRLEEDEIEWLRDQLIKTIDYTKELEKFCAKEEHDAVRNINVFREDRSVKKDSSNLLAQAPETRDTYFVVPKILDQE